MRTFNVGRSSGIAKVDERQLKIIEAAMLRMPEAMRSRPIAKAQKDAMQPALDASRRESTMISRSGSLGKNLHVVRGKYRRKTYPYVVLKAKSKTENLGDDKFGLDRGKRNWARVVHFGILGVQPTIKRAGVSKGRGTKAKAFAFFDKDEGKVVVVKKIKHTGNFGYRLFDKAFESSRRQVETHFRRGVAGVLNTFLKKQSFK